MNFFDYDKVRYGGGKILSCPSLRFLWVFRTLQAMGNRHGVCYFVLYFYYRILKIKYAYELELNTHIGPGMLIVHYGGFRVNAAASIGANATIFPGVTIGSIRLGKRQGAPTIGNDVYIGANAAIVGGIKVGDDVVIAPNSFVNFDVPSHSVVFGNPGIVKHKDNASDGYIYNKIDFKYERTDI